MAKRGLGKGLQALIPSGPFLDTRTEDNVLLVAVDDLMPNANQPRKNFDLDKMKELAESISAHGIVQPLVVRPAPEGKYEIVVGERRWRAAKLAGCTEIPCLVKSFDEKAAAELALIENIQRENLNSLEEAEAYEKLMREFDYTQEALAARLGKSRPYVANTLRLLQLSTPLQGLLREGLLSAGHARVLLSVAEEGKRASLAQKMMANKLSVRQAEELAKELNEGKTAFRSRAPLSRPVAAGEIKSLPPELKDIEGRLRGLLGTKVKIRLGEKGGRIEIDFYSDDDLERIAGTLLPEATL